MLQFRPISYMRENSPGLRILLREFDLVLRDGHTRAVEDEKARARRARVDGTHERLLQRLLVRHYGIFRRGNGFGGGQVAAEQVEARGRCRRRRWRGRRHLRSSEDSQLSSRFRYPLRRTQPMTCGQAVRLWLEASRDAGGLVGFYRGEGGNLHNVSSSPELRI